MTTNRIDPNAPQMRCDMTVTERFDGKATSAAPETGISASSTRQQAVDSVDDDRPGCPI
ncbi:hypothetical protein JQ596_08555 [Bradyrhizobium manausense]|uniref:hypothetical protein n=1 Tax=Bradyrhizobium manausense TaxID=989370 RepID=UPI001BAC2196|nr:hypothetical protein [Bradyrhizobium manausense]MBR0825586.1 hypothetical protein [Bradyrhizobium manausense]